MASVHWTIIRAEKRLSWTRRDLTCGKMQKPRAKALCLSGQWVVHILNLLRKFPKSISHMQLYKGMLYLFCLADWPVFQTTTEEGKTEPQSMMQKPIGLRKSISPENSWSKNVPRENRQPQPETLTWSLILSYSPEDPRSLNYVKLDCLL